MVLVVFGCICCFGVSESSKVAGCMFGFHMLIITILIIWAFIYGCQDNFHTFNQNYNEPLPDIHVGSGVISNSYIAAIYFGYCSALLGMLLY